MKIFAYKNHKKPYLILSDKLREANENLFYSIVKSKVSKDLNLDDYALNLGSKLHKKYAALVEKGEVAWLYSKKRRFDTVTIFSLQGSEVFVEKKFVDSAFNEIRYKDVIFRSIVRSSILQGVLLKELLQSLIDQGKFKEFEQEFCAFLREVIGKFSTKDNLVSGEAIEALPRNCIFSAEGFYKFFDLEYCLVKDMTKQLLISRICLIDFGEQKEVLDQNFGGNFIKYFSQKIGYKYDKSANEDFIKLEEKFQKTVCVRGGLFSKITRCVGKLMALNINSLQKN